MCSLRIEDIKATLRGVVVRSLKRWPGTFGRRRKWLNETQWWNSDDIKMLQLELLRRVISHAYETVPYYTSIMKDLSLKPDDIRGIEDIAKFPVLHKTDVGAAGDKLVSGKFCRMFTRTAYTGGTTGVRLALKRDMWSIGNEHAFVRRQFDWAGIGLSDPCAYVMWRVIASPGEKTDKPYVYDAAMKELVLSSFHLSEDTAAVYVKALAHYKIKALVGYPSVAYMLAKMCLNNGIRVPLRAVLTTAETLDPAKKEIISQAFECKVYDFYGSSERVCYIHTCEHGSYHIVPEYGLVELVPAGENCCRIVATGFWNMAMPLIRYDIGDLVEPCSDVCPCGRSFPVVKRIIGRESTILTTPSGRMLGPTALECVMENILFAMQEMPVLEGQMVQESADAMTLEYVPLKGFGQKDADKLKSIIAANFPSEFRMNIRPVEKITRTASGKALSLVIARNPQPVDGNI